MTLQAILTALCVLCTATPIIASPVSEQCYRSEQSTRVAHPTEHIYHHKTPTGVCYHVGPKNHSTAFVDTKPLPKKVGTGTSASTVKIGDAKTATAVKHWQSWEWYRSKSAYERDYWRHEWDWRP